RLTLPARRWQRVRWHAVNAPGTVHEHRKLVAAALCRGEELVSGLVAQRERVHFVALRRPGPATLRQDKRYRLARNQQSLIKRLRRLPLAQCRAPCVAICLRVLEDLLRDERLQPRRALQRLLDLVPFLVQLVLLAADLHFLELRQVPESQVQDRLRLDLRQLEAFLQYGLGLILLADDRDD